MNGEWIPLLGIGLLSLTTVMAIAGAWAMGRVRGMQDATRLREQELDTHARLERMERHIVAVSEEIERLGEVQRFALKIIGDRVVEAAEQAKPSVGRVVTPH